MSQQTHEIVIQKPKPADEVLINLTAQYFDARGRSYDKFERDTAKRDLFTESVNKLIAQELQERSGISSILTVACGTGRREREIESLTGRPLQFHGVEVSKEMAQIVADRGLDVVCGDFLEADLPEGENYHAAFVLSSFGHVPSLRRRNLFIEKIRKSLAADGLLFLDVLNLDDVDEWGPELRRMFADEQLDGAGFEPGDVMYRKIGEPEICFYHYFTSEEISRLLDANGFSTESLRYIGYGKHFGEVQDSAERGAIFIVAKKVR
jgi:SAM-dependent methyltransferase